LLAKDGYLNFLTNLLPSVGGVGTQRLQLAFDAVRATWTSGAVFESYKANHEKDFFALPLDQQKNIEDFLKGRPGRAESDPGGFLNGWWTVYDGNYYYYYFALPSVVYTKTRPAPTAGAPHDPANRGTVKPGKDNTFIVTWKPLEGDSTPTVETF